VTGSRRTTSAAATSSRSWRSPARSRCANCRTPARSPGDRPVGPTTGTSRGCSTSWVQRGEVAVAGRAGPERSWNLAQRVYPDDPVIPADEARRTRDARRLRALGIARAKGPELPVEAADVCEAGEPAVVEGVKGEWRVDPSLLGRPFSGRTALLSPFDRLVPDRKRALERSTSSTSSRCTSLQPSAGGATTRCRTAS
jgi:hypothetical protein